jgi:hypothetical protein
MLILSKLNNFGVESLAEIYSALRRIQRGNGELSNEDLNT